jgi:hypothetical protein
MVIQVAFVENQDNILLRQYKLSGAMVGYY